jgi:hypothetical protein
MALPFLSRGYRCNELHRNNEMHFSFDLLYFPAEDFLFPALQCRVVLALYYITRMHTKAETVQAFRLQLQQAIRG